MANTQYIINCYVGFREHTPRTKHWKSQYTPLIVVFAGVELPAVVDAVVAEKGHQTLVVTAVEWVLLTLE